MIKPIPEWFLLTYLLEEWESYILIRAIFESRNEFSLNLWWWIPTFIAYNLSGRNLQTKNIVVAVLNGLVFKH